MSVSPYVTDGPDVAQLQGSVGVTLLEFGDNACGHCAAAQPLIAKVAFDFPQVQHLKVADGPGRALGRHYRVKLWPTLVFLRDGVEVARLVRPTLAGLVEEAFEAAVQEP